MWSDRLWRGSGLTGLMLALPCGANSQDVPADVRALTGCYEVTAELPLRHPASSSRQISRIGFDAEFVSRLVRLTDFRRLAAVWPRTSRATRSGRPGIPSFRSGTCVTASERLRDRGSA